MTDQYVPQCLEDVGIIRIIRIINVIFIGLRMPSHSQSELLI